MAQTKTVNIPLNRVEGDLEVRADLDESDGVVTAAWCSGTMFRGFEQILQGRGALDGLVITPRICGICTTSHLMAAALALDDIFEAEVPVNALLMRNLTHAVEHIQSDIRHHVLFFGPDLVNAAYDKEELFEEAVARYTPLQGTSTIEVIRQTKRVLEITAIIGGQWPHSAFMVPGGIVSNPSPGNLLQCKHLLSTYRSWYERKVLGCSTEEWNEIASLDDLEAWLDTSTAHRDSEVGFFVRFGRAIGLQSLGDGCGAYLCFGALELPDDDDGGKPGYATPAGFVQGGEVAPFEQKRVAEHIKHSWFVGYEGGRHPLAGITEPYASGSEGHKYSWAKAPRYKDVPAETGPLAEMLTARNPLFLSLVDTYGPTAFVRQLARLVRPTRLFARMEQWLEAADSEQSFYTKPEELSSGRGYGLTHATRGALGHWVQIDGNRITHYQVITPTAWNASPRDSAGVPGPMEQALTGVRVADPDNPVELAHIVRSFDPCLVCTVHTVTKGRQRQRLRLAF